MAGWMSGNPRHRRTATVRSCPASTRRPCCSGTRHPECATSQIPFTVGGIEADAKSRQYVQSLSKMAGCFPTFQLHNEAASQPAGGSKLFLRNPLRFTNLPYEASQGFYVFNLFH